MEARHEEKRIKTNLKDDMPSILRKHSCAQAELSVRRPSTTSSTDSPLKQTSTFSASSMNSGKRSALSTLQSQGERST